jgi:hypothetical protein
MTAPTYIEFLGGALRPISLAEPSGSHVLIDKDRVSIRVHSDEAGQSCCALVRPDPTTRNGSDLEKRDESRGPNHQGNCESPVTAS